MNENERSNQLVEDTVAVEKPNDANDPNEADLATDLLVEEISIDGMCGVY